LLRKILESELGPLTNSELKEILDLATTDINSNRVSFGKRTSLHDAVEIARCCSLVLRRGKVA
jgi:hypothetical protein